MINVITINNINNYHKFIPTAPPNFIQVLTPSDYNIL